MRTASGADECELATALFAVTFVVLDLETTGGSPFTDRITEIGALKLRGGEMAGTFATLVDPGVPIPPPITELTGIADGMVGPAPSVATVLPSLLEFLRDAVIVGHNIRFDCAFLDAALLAHGYPPLGNRRVDTVGLARRLVRDDVRDLRLATLAAHFRTQCAPVHRAYEDARATAEVFHSLLEHAGTFGVVALDDLLAFPGVRAHRSSGKLALTARLPRGPGAYVLRGRGGAPLFVGSGANLRTRVREHFAEDGRKVPQFLHQLAGIEPVPCDDLAAAVARARQLELDLAPPFNRSLGSRRRRRARRVPAAAPSRAAPATATRTAP